MKPVQPHLRGGGVGTAVAIAAVLLLLLGDAVLEVAGVEVSRLLPLPGPLRDPWLLVIPILLALGVRRGCESVVSPQGLQAAGLCAGDLLPLALAVACTRFVLDSARPLVQALTAPPTVSPSLAAPLYRLGMGGAMLFSIALLLMVPRFRRRMREFASARRLRSGLFFTISVAAVAYAILLGVAWMVAGPDEVKLEVPVLLPAGFALLVGQMAIATGEELFYRGMLQREVTRLFGRAGIARPRDRKLAAMAAVSALFALHHVGPGMTREAFVAVALYSFAMSLLFGLLFDLTGNLAVCSFAHLFNNLMVLRLGPFFAAPGRVEVFGDVVYIAAFLLVAFAFLFLLARDPSARLKPIRPS